jgi:hypothetical protein
VAAKPRRPGRPGQVGEEAARVPGADGGRPAAWRGARASGDFGRPVADRQRGGGARASADFERLAVVENPMGQRTGGAAEGGGRGG